MEAERPTLRELAARLGILESYWDVRGEQHFADDRTRERLVQAMGYPCATEEEAAESLRRLHREQDEQIAPPVVVRKESQLPIALTLRLPHSEGGYLWKFLHDAGELEEGVLRAEDLEDRQEQHNEFRSLTEGRFNLPQPLGWGYHTFSLYRADEPNLLLAETQVIVCPETCYLPPELEEGARFWGVSAQLYGVHSERTIGIGDFGDLRRLVRLASSWGAAFVGLNPLHAVTTGPGPECSPYSPTSRQAFNVLYIDLEEAARFLGAAELEEYLASPEVQIMREDFRAQPLVPYAEVSAFRFAVLERLYQHFLDTAAEPLREAFGHFIAERGAPLKEYGTYAALREYVQGKGIPHWHWRSWPEEFRDRTSSEVARFSEVHADRVTFHMFTQWLAEEQLRAVAHYAREQGMKVGLYMDVALGAGDGGAESWSDPSLFARDIGMGAPPDALAPQGQNWGLPPNIPQRLQSAAYRPFRRAIEAAMRYSGAVRIDHAMSLFRLYWVPGSLSAEHGAYVRYALDDLMGILALESRKNRCVLIGEDLGTVPPEVRTAMGEYGVLSYKVLYFMNTDNRYHLPSEYQRTALVVTSTHDLPTLTGYFQEHDLSVRRELNLHEPEVLQRLYDDRRREKIGLLDVLQQEHLLSDEERQAFERGEFALWPAFSERVHRFLAASASMLQSVQLEDLVGEREQANLPGTIDEHPNWRRRLSVSLEGLAQDERVLQLLRPLQELRTRGSATQAQ